MILKWCEGSPRVPGDADEEDIDDIEHEFNIEDESENQKHATEAVLNGKLSYGRGPNEDENAELSLVIKGEQTPSSSLHKRVHPFPQPGMPNCL